MNTNKEDKMNKPLDPALQERFFATVNGGNDAHLDWLTPVK